MRIKKTNNGFLRDILGGVFIIFFFKFITFLFQIHSSFMYFFLLEFQSTSLLLFSLYIFKKRNYWNAFNLQSINNLLNELLKSFFLAIFVVLIINGFGRMVDFISNGNYHIVEKEQWRGNLSHALIKVTIIITGTIIGPLAEEMFFRRILYNFLKSKLGLFFAIVLQSLIFTGLHEYDIRGKLDIFLFGIAFALIYEKRKTLVAPIFVHSIINAIKLFPFLLL